MTDNFILLSGGPNDGQYVPRPQSRSLLIEHPKAPEIVARYRQSKDRDVYRFTGYDRVIASIPWPPDPSS